MKTITVAELRQNPTAALDDVGHGATYEVTRHRVVVARLVPPAESIPLTPPRRTGSARLADRASIPNRTVDEVDGLLDDMRSDR